MSGKEDSPGSEPVAPSPQPVAPSDLPLPITIPPFEIVTYGEPDLETTITFDVDIEAE